MSTIGTFTKTQNGFSGTINTIKLNDLPVTLVVEREAIGDEPNFRAYSGKAEIGAAWNKEARATGQLYISLVLDDPSFAEPLHASLFETAETPGEYDLVWNRPRRQA